MHTAPFVPATFRRFAGVRRRGPAAACLLLLSSLALAAPAAVPDKGRPGEGPVEEQRAVGVQLPLLGLRPYVLPGAAASAKSLSSRRPSYNARLYVVHLWGTWCEPCKAEFPHLRRMFPDGRYHEAQLLLVALQSPDEDLQKFLSANRANMPQAPHYVDDAASIVKPLKLSKLPLTLLVDAQWVVRQAFSGPITDRRPELLASMDHYLAPLNLSAVGTRDITINKCPAPPCMDASYFMHNTLFINDARRWDRRSNKFTKTELSLPLKNQPNLLYLYSPSCAHCAGDFPILQKVADGWRHSKSKQASIVLVSVAEDTGCTGNYLSQQLISYNNIDVVHTGSRYLLELLATQGGSLMLIMNRQGYIRNAYVGSLNDQRVAVTESLIAASLGP